MLYINKESARLLDALFNQSPHALLLTGAVGIGLATIAQHYTQQKNTTVLTVLPEKDDKVDLEKGIITVASIRRLYDVTRTVEPKGRTIIIDYAERMAPAAQNAFLKLLEEPSEGTHFILLTHQPELLLPTITSRSQRIDVRPISSAQSQNLLDDLKITDATKRTQLLFIADGLPAALTRLVEDSQVFETRASLIKDARVFITGSTYDRLEIAKKYKDSRRDALILVEDSLRLLKRTLAAKGDASTLRLITRLEHVHKRLSEQGNVRLQLSAALVV